MHNDTTVQELESNIREAKKIVELNSALDRLYSNRDFKAVVTEGYFQKEAVRLVHLKADPSMQTPERQASVVAQIDAIGALSSYLRLVAFNGQQAVKAIEGAEEAIAEVLEDKGD